MSGDRLAQIEERAIDALATNGYGFGYEHMGDMWRDMEPLCRDVLALVEIAKTARNLIDDVDEVLAEDLTHHATEQKLGAIFLGYGGGWNHEEDLRSALARLVSGAAEGDA